MYMKVLSIFYSSATIFQSDSFVLAAPKYILYYNLYHCIDQYTHMAGRPQYKNIINFSSQGLLVFDTLNSVGKFYYLA